MNPDPARAPFQTDISDFSEILEFGNGSDVPVVVGGHAVNLWCHYYQKKGVTELSHYLPFTSKDLDLVGTIGLLERLHLKFKGKLQRSEPRSPVLGRIELTGSDGKLLLIEVLHTVKGLDQKELDQTMVIFIDRLKARVLMPQLILKAKIENTTDINQDGRNDVKHVRMMILCMRAFIIDFVNSVSEGKVTDRALINLLEKTFATIRSTKAEKSANLWGFDFRAVWPIDVLQASGSDKVQRWLEHRMFTD